MLNLRKIFIIVKKEKKVIENFSFLSILQVSQLLIGFLVYPYLIKILGNNNYGILAYAQVVISFLLLFVNYGFNATATKQIAIQVKKNNNKINTIINSVFCAKFLLCILSFIILFILVYTIPFMYEHKNIYFYTSISLIGWTMYPEWYFQGIEKMKNITYSMLISKMISLLMIFILIKKPSDFFKVPIINSFSIVLAAIIGLFLFKKSISYFKFYVVKKKDVLFQYKEGFSYFSSNITANAKDFFSTILIGAFLNYKDVAVFDLANKIVKILFVPCSILARAIFPKVSVIKSKLYNMKIERLLLVYFLIVVCIIFMIPDSIFSIIIDENFILFRKILRLLSLTLPLLVLANTRGFLGLVAFGYDFKFMTGILLSVSAYILVILAFIFFDYLDTITISICIIISLLVEVLIHSINIKKIYEKS